MRNTTLTHAQQKAIQFLLEGNEQKVVATMLGKDRTTIHRWSKLPEFEAALQDGKQTAFQEASHKLASTTFRAAATLEEIIEDPDSKPELKIKAACEILNYAIRLSDQLDLAHRISLLEAAANLGGCDE
jgi:hypothetical protein